MQNKKWLWLLLLTLIPALILLVVDLFVSPFDQYHLILRDVVQLAKVCYILGGSVILWHYKARSILLGCLFVSISWIWNFVSPFIEPTMTSQLFSILDLLLYQIFSFLGISFMLGGIWLALNHNVRLIKMLKKIAFYDPLTKLSNRNLLLSFTNKDDYELDGKNVLNGKEKRIILNKKCAFVYIDIDDFKMINDSLGHSVGDQLLTLVAKRFNSFIDEGDIIVRLAGDEFVMILYDDQIEENIELYMQDLHELCAQPFVLENRILYLSISIGVSLYPQDGRNLDVLIQKADMAMYTSKKRGKNQWLRYHEQISNEMNAKFDLLTEIKQALQNEEFVVYFQPKANIETNQITGYEALVRWNHKKRGLVFPKDFIPLLEESRNIIKLDQLVFINVLNQMRDWRIFHQKFYKISINISTSFFFDTNFLEFIDTNIHHYDVDPKLIGIELTENVAIHDFALAKNIIVQLKKRGINVFLDDFGKGYSSLIYLKEFPIDYLKIDKGFIDEIETNVIDQTMVKCVIEIANIMGIQAIGEGIETQGQLDCLRNLGCHEYQGFLLSKAVPLEVFQK